MNKTWVLFGATSIIAQEFAHIAAQHGCSLILIGRASEQLGVLAADFRLRYHTTCETILWDFAEDVQTLVHVLQKRKEDISLFLAHSLMVNNNALTAKNIDAVIRVNINSTIQFIHGYFEKPQAEHQVLFVSSVAAVRGRAKNSLYGGSKAAVEVYLEGLQQSAKKSQTITIASLGFIDTKLTFGEPGIFYASSPKQCAKACWKAIRAGKRRFYHPWFWRWIMGIIYYLPFFLFLRVH
jgi:short-subunit dehydrogenase